MPDDVPITDGLPPQRRNFGRTSRLLRTIAVAETITLTLLLVNIGALGNDAGVARAVGPVHGTLYLCGVLLTWLGPFSRGLKVLAIVPIIGTFAAARISSQPTPAAHPPK